MSEKNLVKIEEITPQQVAGICDHTFLNRPESYRGTADNPVKECRKKFQEFLQETIDFPGKLYAVCVRPEKVRDTWGFLYKNNKSHISVASVIGFPDGDSYGTNFKLAEMKLAINEGATEIDFVLNHHLFIDENAGIETRVEISNIEALANKNKILTKMILETSELTNNEIIRACQLADKYKIDFVKTSSGFTNKGAATEHLRIMRENFSGGVKISGGVNSENYQELLKAASGRTDGYIELDPKKIRIGESSLLKKLFYGDKKKEGY